MAEWYEYLTNPVGNIIDDVFGLSDEDIGPAESSYVRPINPLAGAQEAEAQRLQAIAEGRADDPSVTGMQQALDRAGGQAYGLGRSSGLQSAAARGRLARGGQLAVERDAPELVEAQRLQTQQAAQAGLLGIRQDQRGIEQARLEDEKNRALRGEIRPILEMEAKRSGIKGAIGEAGSTLLGLLSDERLKENVEPGQPQTREFLEALSPKSFDYKGAQPQEPQQLGVMAQDLQQSQQGAQMVSPQPAYGGALAVDPTQATGPMLAALGDLNERLNQVEVPQQPQQPQRPPEPQLPPPPTYAPDPHALRSPDAPPPGMTTALAASAHAPRPLASSQMESAQIGAIMKKTAEEEVLGKFGGNMQAYDAWHRALPAAQRAQIRNWGDAMALLEKGPIAPPEGAPLDFDRTASMEGRVIRGMTLAGETYDVPIEESHDPEASRTVAAIQDAFEEEFGEPFYLTEGNRTIEEQLERHDREDTPENRERAAKGTHVHGTGFDFNMYDPDTGIKDNQSRRFQWMVKNGAKYGFYWPGYEETPGGRVEWWHWEHDPEGVASGKKKNAPIPAKHLVAKSKTKPKGKEA